jgi:hypothetical protein
MCGHDARKGCGQARAGDDHAQAARARILCVVRHHVGIPVGAHHADLAQDLALVELLLGLFHHRHVALRPHHDAHSRRVDL